MKRHPRIREKWESVDGRRVRIWMLHPAVTWRDAMERPPILLIHGLGCSVEVWTPTLGCLAQMRRLDRPVYAVDLPGYGKSKGPRRALGIAEMADWTARLLDVLGIPRVHVGGNSLGCQVALALARRHPERAGGLVLVGPTEGADVVPFWRTAAGLLADVFFEPTFYNGTLLRTFLQMGIPRYFGTVRRMILDDPVYHADEVKAPCLIVRGSRDLIVPEWAARLYARRLPRGEYVRIEGSAHAAQYNAPKEFTRIALAFWRRVEEAQDSAPAPVTVAPYEASSLRARSRATAAAVSSTR